MEVFMRFTVCVVYSLSGESCIWWFIVEENKEE